ncbi:hypothetical protein DFP72DRAFT_1069529 [Ephemerocybe angulata]|uniref:Uncharacterized protein n=1 Tax=Ephemerocybe angulata TaxID=980116 RepID=A0A8H6HXF4_9AGAR|nr:hypothetical protein DFP72DRAFT_1069529 [Tulosesus angulatus]
MELPRPFSQNMPQAMNQDSNGQGRPIGLDVHETASGKVRSGLRRVIGILVPNEYKEKYTGMKDKLERAARSQEIYQKQLEIANAKIKKLQVENDLLLDALLVHDEPLLHRYFPPNQGDLQQTPIENNGPGPLASHRDNYSQNHRNGRPHNERQYPHHPTQAGPPPPPPQSHYPPSLEDRSTSTIRVGPASAPRRSRRQQHNSSSSGSHTDGINVPHPNSAMNPPANPGPLNPPPPHQSPNAMAVDGQGPHAMHTPISPTPPGHGGHSFGRYPHHADKRERGTESPSASTAPGRSQCYRKPSTSWACTGHPDGGDAAAFRTAVRPPSRIHTTRWREWPSV